MLSIKFEDIHSDRLIIKEIKAKKLANIQLNQKALTTIKQIQAEHPNHVSLFQSYRNQQALHKAPKPLTRLQYQKPCNVGVSLGTHSMRKTRVYHLYQNTKNICRVMKMLRHSSEGVTLRYIGITQDDVDKDFVELEI